MPSLRHDLLKLSLNSTALALSFGRQDVYELRNMLEISTLFVMLPWGVRFEKVQLPNYDAEWLIPYHASPHQVMLYLHGGGYAIGSPQSHRAMVGQLAKLSGRKAFVPNYRKVPEHTFPAPLEDALEAYQYLLQKGFTPENITLAGDSAGGGLVIATLLEIKELGLPMPSGAVCFSPWTDLTLSSESIKRNILTDPFVRRKEMEHWGKLYAGKLPLNHPKISPAFADLSGLPPVLVQVSNAEALYDDAIKLTQSGLSAGSTFVLQEWSGLMHWWQGFWRLLPEAEEALKKAAEFQKKIH